MSKWHYVVSGDKEKEKYKNNPCIINLMKQGLEDWWNSLSDYQKQCLKDFVDGVEKGLKKSKVNEHRPKF